MTFQRIAVGMSGGVDSSLAAMLLQEQGYSVVGITLQMLPGPDDLATVERARTVAAQIGVPHVVADCRAAFCDQVLQRCWEQYRQGETPNPCVVCNRHIKFGWLLEHARELGCDAVATGHYARLENQNGVSRLLRGTDANKDQSYFLCNTTDAQRAHVLFPLGCYTKPEVRTLAAARGLASAHSADSQDICFDIHAGQFPEFMRQQFGELDNHGTVLDDAGKIVARHQGTQHFTIGQRKGLGVALGAPAFVRAIDPLAHTVHLTTQPASLLSPVAHVRECNWHGAPPTAPFECLVQTRYRQTPIAATVTPGPDFTATLEFAEPVRAVSPGQWAVFYQDALVLGGGILLRG